MKSSKAVVAVLAAGLVMLLALPTLLWTTADSAYKQPLVLTEASSLYKSRCAACHGLDGLADTPAAKKQNIPSFASDAVRKLTTAEIQDEILNGGKDRRASHTFATKGLSASEGAKLAVYVKELGNRSRFSSR